MEPTDRASAGIIQSPAPSPGPYSGVSHFGTMQLPAWTGSTAAASEVRFRLFKFLPAELRAGIWRHAFEPRILRISLSTQHTQHEAEEGSEVAFPVALPGQDLAKVTESRRALLQTCSEARAELLRLLPDFLPLGDLENKQARIHYHRLLDLICYQHVSPAVLTHQSFIGSPGSPIMSFPVQSIAFGEYFINSIVDNVNPNGLPHQSFGYFLEMMPSVKRIYVVNVDVQSVCAAYPFRIMTGKHGRWISLHHDPEPNPNVLYIRDFSRTVKIGQELCAIIRGHPWRESMIREQDITVFVLTPSSSRAGFAIP